MTTTVKRVDKRMQNVHNCGEVIAMTKNVKSTTMNIRVNPEIKKKAMEILDEIGLSASELFNMLLNQVAIQQKVPFDLVSSKYICEFGYVHDYSKIDPPDEDDYTTFESWEKAKEWLDV